MAERSEFELPVPICERSDNSIMLSFATSSRTAKWLEKSLASRNLEQGLGTAGAHLLESSIARAIPLSSAGSTR